MLRITKLTDYSIVLLGKLATNYPKRQSAAVLAQETGIGLPTVSKLLKALQRHHFVVSYLGIEGGYELAGPPGEFSLAQIISALEGPIAITECNIVNGQCAHQNNCQARSHWLRINQAVLGTLKGITLVELMK